MEFRDKRLMCVNCGEEFIFSAGEQQFFSNKGLTNQPKRCKRCKAERKESGGQRGGSTVETAVLCAGCGQETTVPFKPRGDRPVYCRGCFQEAKARA